jgi:hypothetical protein
LRPVRLTSICLCLTLTTAGAGCYISLGNFTRAQELLDAAPAAMDKKKMSGKDLPTEVFIKKKRECLHREGSRC